MRKPGTFVQNAAIKFSGALSNVTGVKRNWIWIKGSRNKLKPTEAGLTAEAQRTQRLFFDLFSFERKENK